MRAAAAGGEVASEIGGTGALGTLAQVIVLALLGAAVVAGSWGLLALNRWLRRQETRQLEAWRVKQKRLRYHGVDFGGLARPRTTKAPAVTVDTAPLTPPPAGAVLAEVFTEPRSPRARAADGVVMAMGLTAVILAILIASFADLDLRSDAGAPEAVAELLSRQGYAAPRVERRRWGVLCARGLTYQWSAMGARGRACVSWRDGEIDVAVRRTWKRPAATQ